MKSVRREQKKRNDRGGGAKRIRKRLPANPTILKNCVRPLTQFLIGAVLVNYLALETSIKPGILRLRASQIWSHLICGRRLQMPWTDIYLSRVCPKVYEIKVLSKYNWRSNSGD